MLDFDYAFSSLCPFTEIMILLFTLVEGSWSMVATLVSSTIFSLCGKSGTIKMCIFAYILFGYMPSHYPS
jgi:hypothetical protein